MDGFVEKLWKFVTATYSCSMYAPLVTRHISTRQSNSCRTRVNISSSTPAVAVVTRCFRSSKVTGTGGTKTLSLTYPHKNSHRVLARDFVGPTCKWHVVTCCAPNPALRQICIEVISNFPLLTPSWAAVVKLPGFLYKTVHSECRYL
jgi:hypothetical protein